MRKSTVMIGTLLVAAIISTLCGCGGKPAATPSAQPAQPAAPSESKEAKSITLSLGTINAASSVDGMAAEKFKELVESKSNGRLKVNIFHNSQLGPTMTQIEGVMMGSQDMLMAGMELYEKWAPDLRILALFYVFRDDAHFDNFFKSQVFANIEAQLAERSVKFVNRKFKWVTGPYRVFISTKPVNTPDDLKGMSVRVPEVETGQKTWRQLGATPVTVTWSETYLALKQGLVQGLEAPVSIVRPNKFQEVCKYITEMRSFPQRMGLAMNTKKLESLDADLQRVIYESADEAGDFYTAKVAEAAKADVEAMVKDDRVTYLKPDLGPWKAKALPLIEELEKSGYIRKGLYAEIQAIK